MLSHAERAHSRARSACATTFFCLRLANFSDTRTPATKCFDVLSLVFLFFFFFILGKGEKRPGRLRKNEAKNIIDSSSDDDQAQQHKEPTIQTTSIQVSKTGPMPTKTERDAEHEAKQMKKRRENKKKKARGESQRGTTPVTPSVARLQLRKKRDHATEQARARVCVVENGNIGDLCHEKEKK